jgi:hypothetical protein
MPSEQEVSKRTAEYISGLKPAQYAFETMNPTGSIAVRYDAVHTGNTVTLERVTEYGSIGDYLYAELFESLLSGRLPKKCRHCGNYFMIK